MMPSSQGVREAHASIQAMIAERGIEPCPRMNTELCLYDAFPDEEELPISFDSCVLQRCDRCIFRVLGGASS